MVNYLRISDYTNISLVISAISTIINQRQQYFRYFENLRRASFSKATAERIPLPSSPAENFFVSCIYKESNYEVHQSRLYPAKEVDQLPKTLLQLNLLESGDVQRHRTSAESATNTPNTTYWIVKRKVCTVECFIANEIQVCLIDMYLV